tara:strand:+ start:371 stop:2353 length:1983 start_codon:yes stop_codon:yes gene_type:complete
MKILNPPKELLLKVVSLIQNNNLDAAEDDSIKLISKYGDSFILFNILGLINANKKIFDKAIVNYKKSIDLNINYPDAYNNLGLAYFEMGETNLAKSNFEEAIKLNNKFNIAYTNLAKLYFFASDYKKSLKYLSKSLEIDSSYLDSMVLLKELLCANIRFDSQDDMLYLPIINLITKYNLVQPTYISRSVISILKAGNDFQELLKIDLENIDKNNLLEILEKLKKNHLLIEFMKVCPLPDLELENIFKKMRNEILFFSFNNDQYERTKEFIEALAEQCFLNEYIYNEDKNEKLEIDKIERNIVENINFATEIDVTKLSLYRALSKYFWVNKIDKKLINLSSQRILNEIALEKKLREGIKSIGESKDAVSYLVKEQYEENPYPRWTKPTLLLNKITVSDHLKKFDVNLNSIDYEKFEKIDILIAGCGTGQHAINTSSIFQNSHITALDLSFNSLAYAKRKSLEMKIDNIDFIQGDLLDIKNLQKKFNIIECVGVIHHMSNPIDGLRSLVKTLKDDGLIKLGLYSKLARRYILKFREENLRVEQDFTIKYIRKKRIEIINSNDHQLKSFTVFNDFFTLSDFRDMLFHVKEHSYSIDDISNILNDVGLKFCGFIDFKGYENSKFNFNLNTFDKFNLLDWDEIEKRNPDMFSGMYQFWCKKVDKR